MQRTLLRLQSPCMNQHSSKAIDNISEVREPTGTVFRTLSAGFPESILLPINLPIGFRACQRRYEPPETYQIVFVASSASWSTSTTEFAADQKLDSGQQFHASQRLVKHFTWSSYPTHAGLTREFLVHIVEFGALRAEHGTRSWELHPCRDGFCRLAISHLSFRSQYPSLLSVHAPSSFPVAMLTKQQYL